MIDINILVGSDLPSIFDLNRKYGKTVFEFAKQKAGIIPNDFKGNEFTKYGQIMEPLVSDYINALYNVHFIEANVIDEKRHLRGNCDGIDRNNNLLLEVKTFGKELDVKYYSMQIQFYLELFNIDKCYLVGYKRPNDFYTGIDYDLENDSIYFDNTFNPDNLEIHEIFRSREEFERIYKKIETFQNCIEALKLEPNMSEDEFLDIYTRRSEDLLIISNKLTVLENKLKDYKQIEKEYKELKEKMYEIMKETDTINFSTEKISIIKVDPSISTSITINIDKLKKDEPEIYEKYMVEKITNKKGYVLIKIKEEK